MANPLHPGLYFDEVAPSVVPMQPVSTAIAGFVGIAQMGPVNVATLVTSWSDFIRQFGNFISNSYLAYAVKGFFDNGGAQAYIVRTTHYDATGKDTSVLATATLKDGQTTPASCLTVNAKSNGSWGNALVVKTAPASWGGSYFKLIVLYNNKVVETFDNLSNDPNNSQFVQGIINGISNYISVASITATSPSTTGTQSTTGVNLAGGADGTTGIVDADYIGTSAGYTGLYAFDKVNGGINLVAVPGVTTSAVQLAIQTYVEGKTPQTVFGLLDPPLAQTVTQIQTYRQTTAPFDTDNAGLFYPNVIVSDPIAVGKAINKTKIVPPSGHIAGIISRTDRTRGVFKAPAGLSAVLQGVIGVETLISDADQDLLNPIGINVIRSPLAGAGIVVWGSRTATMSHPEYNYIPVRRTVQFIENTINKSLGWAVFEPNNQVLWDRIKATVSLFLSGIWQDGGLAGSKASEAFQVVCDASNNSSDSSQVTVDISVAPVNPAEFVTFRIGLKQQ